LAQVSSYILCEAHPLCSACLICICHCILAEARMHHKVALVFVALVPVASALERASRDQPVLEAAGRDNVIHAFGNGSSLSSPEAGHVQQAFDAFYQASNDSFDHAGLELATAQFHDALHEYRTRDAYVAFKYKAGNPHCDVNAKTQTEPVKAVAPFPGGVTQNSYGSDFAKHVYELGMEAQGPAAAGLVPVSALTSQSLSLGMGMLQSVVAGLVHTIPPLVPPPAWNNQPLPCVPMVTGHNCFGAVLYPITMADFVIADVTDAMLDGVIAGFPNTYATKVGQTSDEMYQSCFASYMSMHCSSVFPRCSAPQSSDAPSSVGGRVPVCLHQCILPLVMCPGFWVDDIIGVCSMVSVPPLCTQAFYMNLWRLPPQYVNYDEANPFPTDCPQNDFEALGSDMAEDLALFDTEAQTLEGSSPMKGPTVQ